MKIRIPLLVFIAITKSSWGVDVLEPAPDFSPGPNMVSEEAVFPELEITFTNKSASSGLIDFLSQSTTWQDFLSEDSYEPDKTKTVAQKLKERAKLFLCAQGFFDPNISCNTSTRGEKVFISLNIEEGEASPFLGYQLTEGLPDWLGQLLGVLLGQEAKNTTGYLGGLSELGLKWGGIFTTHSGDLSSLANPQVGPVSWFGEADLLSPVEQGSGFVYPGFTYKNHRLILSLIRQDLAGESNFSNQRLILHWDELNLLAACFGARRGYPATDVFLEPKKVKDGFLMMVGARNLEQPLKLGKFSFSGLNIHDPNIVKEWIMEKVSLQKGQTLTTADMVRIRSSLLQSCSFYHVGVRPDRLSGPCELLITLSDDVHLPRLGDSLPEEDNALVALAGFIHNKPTCRISFKYADKQVVFVLDQANSMLSLKITDLFSNRPLSLSFYRDNFYLHENSSNLSGLQFPMTWGGTLAMGATLNPKEERSRQFFMGVGSSSLIKGMSVATYFTPACLMYSKSGKLFESAEKVNDKWVFASEDSRLSLKMVQENVTEALLKFGSSPEWPVTDLEILLTSEREGPDPSGFSQFKRSDSVDFSSRFQEELRGFYPVPKTAEGKWFDAIFRKVLLPKILDLFSLSFQTDSDSELTHQSTDQISAVSDLVDPDQKDWVSEIRSVVLPALNWEEDTWPDQFLLTLFNLQQNDLKSLSMRLEVALESGEIGPLGNLAFAALCKQINFTQGTKNFFFNARVSNTADYFLMDLEKLNLVDGIFAVITELQDSPELQQSLFEYGVTPQELARFFAAFPQEASSGRQAEIVEAFVSQFYEKLISPVIQNAFKQIMNTPGPSNGVGANPEE